LLAFPNPALPNDNTVSFILKSPGLTPVALTLFDPVGNVVFSESLYLNTYAGRDIRKPFVTWNLRNKQGRRVVSGMYCAVIKIKDRSGTVKTVKTYIGIKE